MSSKWTGYYKVITPQPQTEKMFDNQDVSGSGLYGNYSWYSRFLQGSTYRLQRYKDYESMDSDVEVALALDTIAEHISENNDKTDLPIDLDLQTEENQEIKNSMVLTLRSALKYWANIHDLENKLFKIARGLCIYGDVFFQKTNDFGSWQYLNANKIIAAIVDENDVTKIIGYQVKTGAEKHAGGVAPYSQAFAGGNTEYKTEIIPADRIVRFTLNDDMSDMAPFGESILRPVLRSHRQKLMLEDAILIYRVQRAPERRVYYIDVGNMPPQKVKRHLEQMKNEIRQKKIPSMQGGQDMMESVYNVQSMCIDLETKIPLLDGRTLTLNEIIGEHEAGKELWAYSINPEDGEVVPGLISWAGITRKNAETIKLTFDNGDELICTPDHKIPVQGKTGFVEAQNLTEHDSLFPFNIKEEKINKTWKTNCSSYNRIYNPRTKGWKYVHNMVNYYFKEKGENRDFVYDDKFKDELKNLTHHIDMRSKNNNPDNLCFMSMNDHSAYHLSLCANQEVIFSDRLFARFEEIVIESNDAPLKDLMVIINSDEKFLTIYKNDNPPQEGKKYKIKLDKIRQKLFLKFMKTFGYENWREYRCKKLQNGIDENKIPCHKNEKDIMLLQMVITLVKEVSVHADALTTYLKDNKEDWTTLCDLYNEVIFKNINKTLTTPKQRIFDRISTHFGYNNFKHLVKESSNFNHRVVKIEPGPRMHTGTLTIDGDEKYHNYHTFAITSIFIRNSEDFFLPVRTEGKGSRIETLPGGCLDLSTKIPLLDGRTLKLEEIIKEHQQGKQLWAYSADPKTGEIVPGIISWAGVTHNDVEVYELELDNGEKVIATPDHKFPVWGKGDVRLDNLKVGDSFIHFETREEKIDKRTNTYTKVYDNNIKEWKFVHRLIRNYMDRKDGKSTYTFDNKYINESKNTIHHINTNRFDNTPNNLVRMGAKDHFLLHSANAKEINTLIFNDPKRKKEYQEHHAAGIKRYYNNMTDEERNKKNEISISNLKNANFALQEKYKKDPEFKRRTYEKMGRTLSKRLSKGGDLYEQSCKHLKNIHNPYDNQEIIFTPDMYKIVNFLFDNGHTEAKTLVPQLNLTKEFTDLWSYLNSPQENKICNIQSEFKHHHLDMMMRKKGYDNWDDYKHKRLSDLKIDDDCLVKLEQKGHNMDEINLLKFTIDLIKKSPKPYVLKKLYKDTQTEVEFSKLYKIVFTKVDGNNKRIATPTINRIKDYTLQNISHYFGYDDLKHLVADRGLFNHRVVGIKKLEQKMDVGTLTIDSDERYHNFHNFALGIDIITKNSGLGRLEDLEYFQGKVWRGLRVPLNWMKPSSDSLFSDDRVGTAYIEEIRFTKFVERLQGPIEKCLDHEFKLYLSKCNIVIDDSLYKIKLPKPTNFGSYRQQQMDSELLNTMTTAHAISALSKRFGLQRYGQLNDDDILLNERLKMQEMGIDPDNPPEDYLQQLYNDMGGDLAGGAGGGLGDIGMEPGMIAGEGEPGAEPMPGEAAPGEAAPVAPTPGTKS